MTLDIRRKKFMEVGSRDCFDGLQEAVLRISNTLVCVVREQVSHDIVKALLILRAGANLHVEHHSDNLAFRIVGDRRVVGIVAAHPCVPACILEARDQPAGSMLQGVDCRARVIDVLALGVHPGSE